MSYREAFDGDITAITDEQWAEKGFNNSVIHTDIMQTTDRTVTATLEDGSEKVIYKSGEFQV